MTRREDIRRYIETDVQISFRHDRAYSLRQRAFDLAVVAGAAVVAGPVLGLAALAVWLEDGGSPLFKQHRVGQFGRLFTIYKLRTMRLEDCRDAVSPTGSGDRRITRIGAFLRKTSIDELPQLINVIRGEMAIVGPRPEMPLIVNGYQPWQHCRHLRKPGITGLWQVSVRKRIPLHHADATKIDLEYVRTASTRTDGRILVQTFAALVRPQGAF